MGPASDRQDGPFRGAPRPVWAFLASVVLVGSSAALAVNAGSSIVVAVGLPGASQSARNDPHPLDAELPRAATVLAEDLHQSVPGRSPDRAIRSCSFGSRSVTRVWWNRSLSGIATGQFDAIVLTRDLGDPASAAWYRDFAFGLPFYEATLDNYRLCSVSGGFFLYFANSRPCPA